jgi:hypothetical protein
MGFEPRIFPYIVKCLDHTTRESVENQVVTFGQYKILKLLLENSSYRHDRGGWKNKLEKMLRTCRVPLSWIPCKTRMKIKTSTIFVYPFSSWWPRLLAQLIIYFKLKDSSWAVYNETSLNKTLRKPALPEYRPNIEVPAKQFFVQKKSHKTGYPSKPANYFGPGLEKFHCILMSSLYNHFPISFLYICSPNSPHWQ